MHATARVWRCGRFEYPLGARPLIMGIVNVTPDSFSDGGSFVDPLAAITHAGRMAVAGARIIDVGGESTRPGAAPVSPAEELARVRPVIAALARDLEIAISIDTRNAETAAACVEAGASIVNDVSGFRDPAMREVVAGSLAGCVVMHMLGDPGTMQVAPSYRDVVAEVAEYLVVQAGALEAAGVARERIAIDPGIGFGKTVEHNLELLRRLPELAELGYPVVIGASRKSFLGAVLDEPNPSRRLEGSLAAALWAASHGADVVRVHDVSETARALTAWAEIEGRQR